MEKLIFRKFFKDTFYFFIIGTISLSLIVWVIQAVNYLDFVSEDGHSFKVYFLYTLLSFPKIFSRLILFMFFISIFYNLSRYEEKNELLIFWTNGVRKTEFVNFIIKFSLIIVFIHLFFNIYIVPKSQDAARSYIRSSSIDYFPSLIKSKQFVSNVKGLTLFVEEKKEDGELLNIFLKDNKNKNKSQIISAKKGIIKKDNSYYLILFDGNEKSTNILSYNKTQINLSNYQTRSTIDPKIQEQSSQLLSKCIISIYKFNKPFNENVLICNQKTFLKVVEEMYKRIIIPFYVIIIAVVASSLLLKSENENNFVRFKIIIFCMGIMFIILSQLLTGYLGTLGILNILLIFFPFIITFFIYFSIQKRLGI